MKRSFFVVVTLAILTFSAFGQKSAANKVDPSKDVKAAFERLIDGIKQVDVDKVMNSYEKSDKLLVFNNNGTATIGWSNVKSNVDATYPKITNVALETTGLRVEMLSKTTAYVSCKWTQSQENSGKLESASGRMTLIYRLIGKDWKVIHRHTSPDNPAASRPVMDSERTNP